MINPANNPTKSKSIPEQTARWRPLILLGIRGRPLMASVMNPIPSKRKVVRWSKKPGKSAIPVKPENV
ncbi:MAG: hypothetical protein ACLU4J_18220 [Butyricimonas paravirosa]